MPIFSTEECLQWKGTIVTKASCCSNPNLCPVSIQEKRGDEISTYYKICMNCNKKTKSVKVTLQ